MKIVIQGHQDSGKRQPACCSGGRGRLVLGEDVTISIEKSTIVIITIVFTELVLYLTLT